jgi:diguanylate cyclase (GGDEF)-like protein
MIVAGLWIALSDRILPYFTRDIHFLTLFSMVKGWLFVTVTALMLYVLIERHTKELRVSEQKYRRSTEDLTAANEELTAVEEELRQQFDELIMSRSNIDRRNRYLTALHETALDLMTELELDLLLRQIVNKVVVLGDSPHGYLYLLDPKTQEMETKVRVGLAIQDVGFRQKKGEGVVGRVWETGCPLIVKDYQTWEGRLRLPAFQVLKVATGFPLKIDGEVIGVFGVNYTRDYVMDEAQAQLMCSFAELAASAIRNARLHSALRENQAESRILIEALPDLIYRIDREGTLLAYELGRDFNLPYNRRGRKGANIREILPADVTNEIMLHVERALHIGSTKLLEYEFAENGRKAYREARFVPINDNEVLSIVRDVTDRKEMGERLRFMSLHDPITGLYNREYFEEELCRLNDERHLPVGIIICDIDGLKLVNDSLGHLVGDHLLIAVANILNECFREGDVVARIGGDEFAILMPSSDQEAVGQACRNIREAIARYREVNPEKPVSLSIGMHVKTDKTENINDSFKIADDKMYREKLHRAQSVRSAIVSTLAKALEARDYVTDGHADRLQDIVETLALAVGVPESQIADFRLLARFHDIGKVGIPDHILFKPAKLTPDEFEIMKRHSEIGYRIALASPDLSPIADWILRHHEWWNGTGYPLGVQGKEIPLACRILTIADAYDAMTNDRPYRKALPQEEALTEIMRCAGRQFDPYLTEEFAKIIKGL